MTTGIQNAMDMDKMDLIDPNTLSDLVLRIQEEMIRRGMEIPNENRVPKPKPARIFQVPDSVKYLTVAQLDVLSQSFQNWLHASRDARIRQSRSRIWLLFLILRHTGMRLGEALELDDRSDLDLERGVIRVRGEAEREVPIPESLIEALRQFFDAPMSLELRGQVFRLDQGYVRRKFSERGAGTNIPRELLNPRVLRHSRAVELLRGGVPLVVVDAMLGHQSLPQSTQYIKFSDADTRRIMNHYIHEEKK